MSATKKRAPSPFRYVPWSRYDALVERLRQLSAGGRRMQARNALALLLGLHGLRVSEVRNLTIDDFDLADEALGVATLKRGKPRRVRLGPGIAAAIAAWREGAGHKPLLFTAAGKPVAVSAWQRFARKLLAEVVGCELKFHALRHTYAMRLYAQTRDMRKVKKRLGHASSRSTEVYVEAWDDLEDDEQDRIGRIESATPSLAERAAEGDGRKRHEKDVAFNQKQHLFPRDHLAGEYMRRPIESRQLIDEEVFQPRLFAG